jgi:hypothetical protein
MTTQHAAVGTPQKKHLVHDEVEQIPGKSGRVHPVRIRIWRSAGSEAVVLASQVGEGTIPPPWIQTRIANYVWKAHLRYAADGMSFFTDALHGNARILAQVHFDVFGQGQRGQLFNPLERPRPWHDLLALIGEDGE